MNNDDCHIFRKSYCGFKNDIFYGYYSYLLERYGYYQGDCYRGIFCGFNSGGDYDLLWWYGIDSQQNPNFDSYCDEFISDKHIFGKYYCGGKRRNDGCYRYNIFADECDNGIFCGFNTNSDDDGSKIKWYGVNPK